MAFTTDFSNLTQQEINGLVTEVFYEASEKRDMDKWNILFMEVSDPSNQVYSYQMQPSAGDPKRTPEGADFKRTTTEQGHKKTVQQYKYTDSFVITDEMRRFTQKHLDILKTPKDMVNTLHDYLDQSKADIINNAFSTSFTDVWGETQDNTTPDGLSLANDSHTVVTGWQSFGNIIYLGKATWTWTPNPSLSREAIVAGRAMGNKFENTVGVKSGVDLNSLLVHTDDEDEAIRIVKSKRVNDSADNDTNESLGIRNIISWNRLTSGRRQLFNAENIGDMFQCNTAAKPTLLPPAQFIENVDMLYKMFCYYSLIQKYPKYMYFSKGTNSA